MVVPRSTGETRREVGEELSEGRSRPDRTTRSIYLTAILLLEDVDAAYVDVPAKRAWKYHVPFVGGEYLYDQRWALVVWRVESLTHLIEPGLRA
jgi:hypothetical protein